MGNLVSNYIICAARMRTLDMRLLMGGKGNNGKREKKEKET